MNVVVLEAPGQTIAPADSVPPTDVGLTVNTTLDETAPQGDVVTVRKYVVLVAGDTDVLELNVPLVPIVVVEITSDAPEEVPTA